MKTKVGIIGVGMVGGALRRYFEEKKDKEVNLYLYDKYKKLGSIKEVNEADIVFVCVPTPYKEEGGFDLSFVEESCKNLQGSKVVVIKSTVWPGTTKKLQKDFPRHKFLFNPEFLVERKADEGMQNPDRQIVGYTEESKNIAEKIMNLLPRAPFEKIIGSSVAEMVKYFGNTFLAIKVIFANQIYDLCNQLGIDYEEVRECGSADVRIGKSHLDVEHGTYRGYGGKCFPKDIRALIQFAEQNEIDLELHKMAEKINNQLMEKQRVKNPEKKI
jgi:UDPglucose 6-dehydrogenase